MNSEAVVVVVEDDAAIADLLDLSLRRAGFRPLLAETGERGLDLVGQHRPVLAIVDIGLPGIDGFEVCRRLERSGTPVLFLTARDGEDDRVAGLELGADDYVVKPFSPRELVARVQAIHRRRERSAPGSGDWLVLGGGVEVDVPGRRVLRSGEEVALATREFDLLAYLARHRGMALSRQQLLDGVWGPGWDGDQRTVDVHVRQLRRKLGDALGLTTVWGVGYRLG